MEETGDGSVSPDPQGDTEPSCLLESRPLSPEACLLQAPAFSSITTLKTASPYLREIRASLVSIHLLSCLLPGSTLALPLKSRHGSPRDALLIHYGYLVQHVFTKVNTWLAC